MMPNNNGTMPQLLHRAALDAGLTDTIPVMPFDAVLHEHSRVDPKARGKCPGDYYGGMWDGMGKWPDYIMTPELAVRWDALRANVGLKMGVRWVGLDIDVTDELLAAAMRAKMDEMSGGVWPVRTGNAPKVLYLFRVAGDPIKAIQQPFGREGVEGRQLIEVLGVTSKGTTKQAVIFGTHPLGMEYTWNMPVSADIVPFCTQGQMDAMVVTLNEVAQLRGWVPGKATSPTVGDGTGSELGAEPVDMSLVPEVVRLIGNDNLEYDDWIAVGYAIKAAMGAPG